MASSTRCWSEIPAETSRWSWIKLVIGQLPLFIRSLILVFVFDLLLLYQTPILLPLPHLRPCACRRATSYHRLPAFALVTDPRNPLATLLIHQQSSPLFSLDSYS